MGLSTTPRALAVGGIVLGLCASPASAGRAADVRVEAFKLLNEGVSAYNRGLYDEAVEKLARSSAISLNSFRAYYYYGLALSASRRYAAALEALEVALDLEPQDLQALIAFGDAHLKLGDVNEARAAYARALKVRPAHAPALDGMGRTYEAQADDTRAIDYYRQAILSNRGHAPAYTHLGDLYMRNDRVREAVRLLEEAVTIRPDFAEGFTRLAVAYGRLGMLHEAVATVQKAIDLDPRDPLHRQTLGWLQLDQSLLNAAERSFREALDADARLAESRLGLAQIARRQGDYELALVQLETALNQDGLDTVTTTRLRKVKAAIEAEELKLAGLEARVAAGEASAEDHADLAAIMARRGRWAEAAALQRLAPPSPEADEWLAYLLFQDGRYREAHAIYERLAAEAAGCCDLRLNAGVSLALLGNDPGAAAEYQAILEQDPTSSLARLYLANAQLRLGRVDEAARNYRSYLEGDAASEPAERVRRILRQIAPELLPSDTDAPLLPPAPPPPPPVDDAEEARS